MRTPTNPLEPQVLALRMLVAALLSALQRSGTVDDTQMERVFAAARSSLPEGAPPSAALAIYAIEKLARDMRSLT